MNGTDELSFYFHIPFCRHLCKFCEYTRFISTGSEQENMYVSRLKRQTMNYIRTHKINLLHGLDIGGGTPTSLSTEAFTELLSFTHEIIDSLTLSDDFESSLEFSFETLDEEHVQIAADNGINRMSTGIQVYDEGLMRTNNRTNIILDDMMRKVSMIRDFGILKLNLDVMYGFENQTTNMLDNTMYVIERLRPSHVTLYEMRYNINSLNHSSITREKLYEQYSYLFGKIKSLGYHGNFGQNAFSLYDNDLGVSSYLRSRMYNCIPYKGFGISAQSMSRKGISYNILKSSHDSYLPEFGEIIEGDTYLLPPDEIAAKYVCISLYSGQFSMKILTDILKSDSYSYYHNEIECLLEHGLAEIENDICRLTCRGFMTYGAVASLFWSANHKAQYMKERESL